MQLHNIIIVCGCLLLAFEAACGDLTRSGAFRQRSSGEGTHQNQDQLALSSAEEEVQPLPTSIPLVHMIMLLSGLTTIMYLTWYFASATHISFPLGNIARKNDHSLVEELVNNVYQALEN